MPQMPTLRGRYDDRANYGTERHGVKAIRFGLQEVGASEAIKDFLNENIDELYPALSFSQQDQNDRVEVDNVSVKEVRVLDSGAVEIDYEYEWSFFSGCKEISDAGIETETLYTFLVGGVIEVLIPTRPEPRTTLDEF